MLLKSRKLTWAEHRPHFPSVAGCWRKINVANCWWRPHSPEEALLTLSAKSCAVKTSQVKADVRWEHGNSSPKWGLKRIVCIFSACGYICWPQFFKIICHLWLRDGEGGWLEPFPSEFYVVRCGRNPIMLDVDSVWVDLGDPIPCFLDLIAPLLCISATATPTS